jgi:hypothetical protein
MTKHDRQQEQLKNVSGGGQTPGTNWGTTPGEATRSPGKKVTTPHPTRGNDASDEGDRTRIESDE